ncbi:thiamine pyrophosphate-binding protein [Devosia naphthalenivorans]|uniref:thiamine pyrophosphate-binding protein n=1 Tax=Devosia naphthalenivorans TaxID=2082392 RepID=UPI0013B06DAE|nr:thiamine pyrophosphate-binding protein [Devosia naphthalenivorans]
MSSKETGSNDEPMKASRRSFLKYAAAGAGAAATSAGMAGNAAAQEAEAEVAPTVPAEIADRNAAPLPKIEFPMTGANLFGRACAAEGVAALFCCPGNYNIIHAIADQGIPSYSGRHEGAMTSAADAFIRATGELAVASGTEGPGFTNMISGLAAANSSRTPLLLVASNMRVSMDDTESAIQVMQQQPLTTGIKKYGKRLITPERLAEYVGYTFRQLKTGIPGPVHIDFTAEVSNHEIKSEAELGYYGDSGLYRTDSRPAPSTTDLTKAIDLINASQRPMIVASTGVFYSKAWDALMSLAEKAQIPVVESGPTMGKFPHNHPLSASAAPDALPSADLVILVGQYCMPSAGEYAFGPEAKYIRIQPEALDIGRNMPINVGIVACEKLALEALADMVRKTDRASWINEIAAARKSFQAQNDEYYRIGSGYTDAVHPAVIAKELGDFLYRGELAPEQTTVVAGGFGIARYTRRYLEAHRPGQVINGAYQFGSIGPDVAYAVGVGAGVQQGAGVQASVKGSPIINITGDAGFGFTGMELETQAKYRLPVVNIVYNNNSWGTWYSSRDLPRGAQLHLFQENLRYDKVAEGLGAHGEYVQTPDQFLPALKRAYEIAAEEGIPSVINCQAKKEFWIREQYEPGFLGKVEPGVMSYYH